MGVYKNTVSSLESQVSKLIKHKLTKMSCNSVIWVLNLKVCLFNSVKGQCKDIDLACLKYPDEKLQIHCTPF